MATAACGTAAAGDQPSAVATERWTLPPIESSALLDAAASDRAEDLCDARTIADDPPAAVTDRYDRETWAEVIELVGRSRSNSEAGGRESRAARDIEASWQGDARLDGTDWDRVGSGQVACPDGYLYRAVALARRPDTTDAGPFARERFADGDIRLRPDLVYRTAPAVDGTDIDLALDLYLPPPEAGRSLPTVVLVHGGGFTAGSRHQLADEARAYARRGFAAITLQYRLDPDAGASRSAHRGAAAAAIDDAREAVRWIRAYSAGLRVDPEKLALLGVSAGGEIALSLAALEPASEAAGPLARFEDDIAAAVSTGAYLTPVIGTARIDDSAAPVLLHHFETDTESGRPWSYAAATCQALRSAGSTCDVEISQGEDHVTGLGPDDPAAERIIPFLAVHLDLT